MNIAFDISVLGMAHENPVNRTGIVRVIENLLGQLVLNEDCDLKLFSNWDQHTLGYSLEYWKNTKAVSSIPFSKPAFYEFRKQTKAKTDALINEVVNDNLLPYLKKVRLKLRIKQLLVLQQLLKKYNNDLVNLKDIKDAEIYHSPFFPLPSLNAGSTRASFFLTCYDLIPILFPHYFERGLVGVFNTVINSLNPKSWVLCISQSTRNDLLTHLGNRINPERVIVTELAASDNFYQNLNKEQNMLVRRKHHIPDLPYALSVCTFEPRKNIDQVIKAFARITAQERIHDLNLVLVGIKGWKFDKILEEIYNREDLKGRIIVTGFVADEDLASLYSDAMFFVYPSFYEGFGLPPLEAMKCGVPVITSNTSSLPEVVGDAGITVSPTDNDALCQAMLDVYKSPTLRLQMAEKSIARASRFSWERCAKETVAAYKASKRN